ncbi:MAG: PhoX family phosphatase [Thiomicrospira sp.]
MKLTKLHIALSVAMAASTVMLSGCLSSSSDPVRQTPTLTSVDFTETPAPQKAQDMRATYSTSKAIYTYSDGSKKTFDLSYKTLFSVGDTVGSNAYPAGMLFDINGQPLRDPNGEYAIAETPDANSLLKIGDSIYLVSHLEYDWLQADDAQGNTSRSPTRKPMGMILTKMQQNSTTGELTAADQAPISFANVDGLWIPCFGSQTPWNTHLGSEEDYDLQYNPLASSYTRTEAGLNALDTLYFNEAGRANPYHYGFLPEVTVKEDGSTEVVKHYAMGRGTWEMAKVMPDQRTAYYGDDGSNVALFMFVADKQADLSAGTLYAAKVEQTGGYEGNLSWIKLGHATNSEVKALADSLTFGDIFNNVAPNEDKTCPTGYTRIRAGSSTDECLTVKTGMEQAAAFLESRRYAALLGATVEFNKMEGIAVNDKDKKLYMAISYLDGGMKDNGLPAEMEHLKMVKINAGATFTLPMSSAQKDQNGDAIDSHYVVTSMYIEDNLRGRDIAADALGNTADPSFIANTDNIAFSEKMRTLFIGEDSGTHVNNFVWAYNVDTQKLTRILTLVAGAEATGLQVVEDMNGHAYIMSNSQHHGDYISSMDATLEAQVDALGVQKVNAGNIGYIGGMPAIK